VKRIPVSLNDQQYEALKKISLAINESMGEHIRRAIDMYLFEGGYMICKANKSNLKGLYKVKF
jgi:hypothetical protein